MDLRSIYLIEENMTQASYGITSLQFIAYVPSLDLSRTTDDGIASEENQVTHYSNIQEIPAPR